MTVYDSFDTACELHIMGSLPSVFGTIEPYNEQDRNTDKEDPKKYPAIYYELLEPINWRTHGDLYQSAKVRMRLHVVEKTLKTPKSRLHAKAQQVFFAFQGAALLLEDTTIVMNNLTRVASTLPKRYRMIQKMEIDFEGELFDLSGMRQFGNSTTTPGFTITT